MGEVKHIRDGLGKALFSISQERIDEMDALAKKHEAERAQREIDERCDRRSARLDAAKDCRITDEVRAALVADEGLRETASLVAARAWYEDVTRKPWLVLAGNTGCGKSVAAAYTIARNGGLWIRAERLVRVFYANFGDQFEEQEKIRDCGLLVLDDVASELDASRMQSALIELLDARKSRRQCTVVTTNLSKTAFAARYGNERLISRLHESVLWVGDGASADMRRAT